MLKKNKAPGHRAGQTQLKLQEMDGVEILPHPAYSPRCSFGLWIVPSDAAFSLRENIFASKNKDWYHNQIRKLLDRWRKVIESDGLYFEE
jgi:hypothetical protein